MNMKRCIPRAALLATLACAPLAALAAGTATISGGGEEVGQLRWLDAETVRMDPKGDEGYLVLREGKTYLVNPEAVAGMPMVMALDGMMQGLAGMFGDQQDGDPLSAALSKRVESIASTGRKETVAGIEGEVYEFVFVDDQGNTERTEAVLTAHALVTEMTEAYLALFGGSMLGAERVIEFRSVMPEGKHGLLRMGDDVALQSISQDQPAADLFVLPGPAVDMGGMLQELMKQIPAHIR